MSVVALRYAQAFADVTKSRQLDIASTERQLADFKDTLAESRDLRVALMDPSIARAQKLKVLDAIARRLGMGGEARNFLAVIIDHQRLDELNEILTEYHAIADEQSGMVEAEITSARNLSPEARRELESQVEKLAGGRVRTTYRQDPSLLGGAVVRIGSTVYDGSLRAQFEQLKQRLVNA